MRAPNIPVEPAPVACEIVLDSVFESSPTNSYSIFLSENDDLFAVLVPLELNVSDEKPTAETSYQSSNVLLEDLIEADFGLQLSSISYQLFEPVVDCHTEQSL